jgi:hypothetical protein
VLLTDCTVQYLEFFTYPHTWNTGDISPVISVAMNLPPCSQFSDQESPGEHTCVYIVTCSSNYKRAFDSLTSYNSYLQLTLALSVFKILCNSLQHSCSLISQLCLQQSCGNGSQRRTSPFLLVRELPPYLSHTGSLRHSRRLSLHKLNSCSSQSQRYFMTDGLSVSLAWCRAPSGP